MHSVCIRRYFRNKSVVSITGFDHKNTFVVGKFTNLSFHSLSRFVSKYLRLCEGPYSRRGYSSARQSMFLQLQLGTNDLLFADTKLDLILT